MIAYIFWAAVLAVVAAVFYWLWRLAAKIEKEEAEDRQWQEYLAFVWQTNPYQYPYWQQMYEQWRSR